MISEMLTSERFPSAIHTLLCPGIQVEPIAGITGKTFIFLGDSMTAANHKSPISVPPFRSVTSVRVMPFPLDFSAQFAKLCSGFCDKVLRIV
jgi:hypothetical protein